MGYKGEEIERQLHATYENNWLRNAQYQVRNWTSWTEISYDMVFVRIIADIEKVLFVWF